MSSEENILTLVEVAQYLHVHPSTIYRLLKHNELQGFKVGRDWRFFVEEIDKLRLSQETLGARTRRSLSEHPALRRSPLKNEGSSSEGLLTKVTDPEAEVGAKTLYSPQSKSWESNIEHQTKALSDAPNDLSIPFTDLSRHVDVRQSDLPRLRQLEEENRRLRKIVADQALALQALKEVLAKKDLRHTMKHINTRDRS